ncbi:hypothetical protein AL08_05900 [Corynebacterium diphtheriae bv. gravis str. ISS 4746]|nr:hypothetical protein AL08_05900 [Corynebacterium diphtheriae bv. gravis str. ISS 4746]
MVVFVPVRAQATIFPYVVKRSNLQIGLANQRDHRNQIRDGSRLEELTYRGQLLFG